MAEYISIRKKIPTIIPSHLKHNERLFSMKAFHKSINNVRMTCLMIYRVRKNFPKIVSSHFVHSLRLLSILARQKSTENKRKICLMIYQNQEKFQKIIPSHLKHIETIFDERISEVD
jgi:hypothetical protein